MRPLRVRERTLADGSIGVLGRRQPDRRGQHRLPRLLRPRLRPRGGRDQLRREPRRRHHLLGHGHRGDGGGDQRLSGVRDQPGVLRAPRLLPGRSPRRLVARNILEHGLSRGELINVNVPAATIEECEGIEVTRLGRRVYQDQLVERLDPRGIPYFWIGGPPPSGLAVEGTDFHAVVNRRIAITPIHLDLTGRRLLRRLNTWAWPSPADVASRRTGGRAPGRRRPSRRQPRPRKSRSRTTEAIGADQSARERTNAKGTSHGLLEFAGGPRRADGEADPAEARRRRPGALRSPGRGRRPARRSSGPAASASMSIRGSRPGTNKPVEPPSSVRRSARTPSTSSPRGPGSRSRPSCRCSPRSCR